MVGEIETRPSRLPFAKRVGNGFFKTALLAAGECFFMDGAGMPGSDPSTPHASRKKGAAIGRALFNHRGG